MKKIYAGIGSRNTPSNICEIFTNLSRLLSDNGFILRSGGADGADAAFEKGSGLKKEIFLPWKGFNGSDSTFYNPPQKYISVLKEIHPNYDKLSEAAKKLHLRNFQQIYGIDYDPVSFVLCWTTGGRTKGGTATAIKLAEMENIPIFNFAREGSDVSFYLFLKKEFNIDYVDFNCCLLSKII